MKLLSIDGGATKTVAVLYDVSYEKILGIGLSGPSNFFSAGYENAISNIKSAMDMAIKDKNEDYEIVMGIAGFGDSERANKIGVDIASKVSKDHKFKIENDGLCAYRLVNLFNDGAVFAPGTGSIGIYQKNGIIGRIGGWGWFAGDEGSASWIARRGLTLAEEQHDGIIDGDSLINVVERYYKLNFSQAINNLEIDHQKRRVALMAPWISDLAIKGDKTALMIINEAADYDARILGRMSEIANNNNLGLVGGTVMAGDILVNNVKKNLKNNGLKTFYGYHVAAGGIILYLMDHGIEIDRNLRDLIIIDIDKNIKSLDRNIIYNNLGIKNIT